MADIDRGIKKLGEIKEKLEDRSKPLAKAAKAQSKRWKQNFNRKGGLYGDVWAGGVWGGSGTLVDTGATRDYVFAMNDAGEITNDAVNWNFQNRPVSDKKWLSPVSHQVGYPNPIPGLNDIPSREIWDWNEEDEERTEEFIGEWVDGVLATYF